MKALAATDRTISAVRKADRLLVNIPGGRFHKGAYPAEGGGTAISWAKITAVTDANNYTASIWTDRNETDPAETSKALYVYDIADALAINDWIPVQASNRTDIDYENIQQLGLL